MARKRTGENIRLKSLDDIFSTEESRQDEEREKVMEIPLEELHPFKNHPFRVTDDDAMKETVESVIRHGILVPAIARPRDSGGYELISGHRRHRAAEIAGKETMPVIVRDLDDDEATIIMVDSNLQRESLLPSERAFAYKMKLEAMKHQGRRTDLTSGQLGEKSGTSVQILAEQAGESQRQIQRYIRLTCLIPEFLEMVDRKQIAFNPAVEISHLKEEEQRDLLDVMEYLLVTPSLSQAQRMKKLSAENSLNRNVMKDMLEEEKRREHVKLSLPKEVIKKYFPEEYTPKQMEETILGLLDQWQKKNRERKGAER